MIKTFVGGFINQLEVRRWGAHNLLGESPYTFLPYHTLPSLSSCNSHPYEDDKRKIASELW